MATALAFLLLLLAEQSPLDRAKALIGQGNYSEARQVLQSLDASVPEVAYLLGTMYFNSREYPQAIGALQNAVKGDPANSAVYADSVNLLARSLYLSGRVNDALPWLEKAYLLSRGSTDILYMLGTSYIQARKPEPARLAFADLFGVAAGSAPAHLVTAQMMIRQEFEESAEAELQEAIRLDPRIPTAHFLLGELEIFRGQFDPAIEEMKKEVAINPNHSMTYYRLGDAYTRKEQWDLAIPALQKSIWLNPFFSGPFILIGKAYFKKGDLANAEGVLRRAVQMDTQNQSAHYLLGQTLMRTGKTEEGKRILQRAQELKKDSDR